MDPGRWLQELKRRRVGRVAITYIVAAFAILQAADIIFPALGVPQWGMTFILVLAALGFVVAVVLAWIFDITAAGVRRTAAAENPPIPGRGFLRRWSPVLLAAGVIVVSAGAYAAYHRLSRDGAGKPDDQLVVVLPFRATSPELQDLSVGMVELLATTLTGEGGLRAADPAAVLGRLPEPGRGGFTTEQALAEAKRLGAAQALTGSVIGAGGGMTITATMHHRLRRRAYTETVTGAREQLVPLIEQLSAKLLARAAGDEQLGSALTGTPLPAVRAYLDGLRLYRSSAFIESQDYFARALDIDSTFATAALYLRLAASWPVEPDQAAIARGRRLAWQYRERLSPADRLLLSAAAGANYPSPSSTLDNLRAWERVVQQTPERPVAWFGYGDMLLHSGKELGIEDHIARSEKAFERALALDSSFVGARQHLLDIAVFQKRPARAKALLAGLPEQQQVYTPHYLGILRALTGDAAAAAWLRDNVQQLTTDELLMQASLMPFLGLPLADAERAGRELEGRAAGGQERRAFAGARYEFLLNAGRPAEAAALARREGLTLPENGTSWEFVLHALYWEADTAVAARAVADIERLRASAEWNAVPPGTRDNSLCALSQWYVARGEADRAATALAQLPADTSALSSIRARVCRLAASAVRAGEPAARLRPALAALDSLLATGPPVSARIIQVSNLASSYAHQRLGETEAAYRAADRFFYGPGAQRFGSTRELQRARLAARLGRRDDAIAAYRTYLALREHAEPAQRPQVEAATRELAALVGEAPRLP